MSESFYRALFPPAVTVMGIQLSRLSLWHLAALEAIQSPFLSADPGALIRVGDLHLAVKVCQHEPGEELDLKPRLGDILTRLRWGRSEKKFNDQAVIFAAWLKMQQIVPEMWDAPSDMDARPISAPLVLYRVSQLIDLGIPHLEAWSMSPGYAVWLLTAHDERTIPGVRFYTERDKQIAAELAKEKPLTRDEQVSIARRELPPEQFKAWLETFNKHHG